LCDSAEKDSGEGANSCYLRAKLQPQGLSFKQKTNGVLMSEKTIFKKIIDGEIPAKLVHEDELCLAFHDVAPQAPIHVLVIPKKEIVSLDDLSQEDQELMGHLVMVVHRLAGELELKAGYRMVVNSGADGGQSVDHLHFHLLGGRAMKWPPG